MLKIYNDKSTCEQGVNYTQILKNNESLIYSTDNLMYLKKSNLTLCNFCVNCNFSDSGIVKPLNLNNYSFKRS